MIDFKITGIEKSDDGDIIVYSVDCPYIANKLKDIYDRFIIKVKHEIDKYRGQEVILGIYDNFDNKPSKIELYVDRHDDHDEVSQEFIQDFLSCIFNRFDDILYNNQYISSFNFYQNCLDYRWNHVCDFKICKELKINNYELWITLDFHLVICKYKPYDNYINPLEIDEVNRILDSVNNIKSLIKLN